MKYQVGRQGRVIVVKFDDGDDVVPTVAGVDVLIDGGFSQELEPELVVLLFRHDDLGSFGVAPDQVLSLDGGSG